MRKRIESWVFNFNSAYIYAFFSGIFVTAAINLLTSTLLLKTQTLSSSRVFGMVSSLLFSSICVFALSALLEISRREWESEGRISDEQVKREDYIENHGRLFWMWFLLILSLVGIILFLLYFSI